MDLGLLTVSIQTTEQKEEEMTAETRRRVEETTDILGVTRTAVPSVYFHLPVFAGKRQRCQQFSAERLQSHHNYCGAGGGGAGDWTKEEEVGTKTAAATSILIGPRGCQVSPD